MMFPGVAMSATWGHISSLPLHRQSDSPSFSVWKSELTIQPDCEVTCAGSVMKTPTALLCWKSPCQTRLPTALFPIRHQGFAASSASGNLSPQTQLAFLTANWASANFCMINSVHSQDRTSPFPLTPINVFSFWLAPTFYPTLYLCSHIPRSFHALF